jgi:hypothetical protein
MNEYDSEKHAFPSGREALVTALPSTRDPALNSPPNLKNFLLQTRAGQGRSCGDWNYVFPSLKPNVFRSKGKSALGIEPLVGRQITPAALFFFVHFWSLSRPGGRQAKEMERKKWFLTSDNDINLFCCCYRNCEVVNCRQAYGERI